MKIKTKRGPRRMRNQRVFIGNKYEIKVPSHLNNDEDIALPKEHWMLCSNYDVTCTYFQIGHPSRTDSEYLHFTRLINPSAHLNGLAEFDLRATKLYA